MREFLPIPRGVVIASGQSGDSLDAAENVDDRLRAGKLHAGYLSEIISDYKPRNDLPCPKIFLGSFSGTMVNWRDMNVSGRLKVLRKSLDMSQAQFATLIGEDPATDSYGSAERSGKLSTRMTQNIYARCEGVDAGWLFHGLTGNLPEATRKRLERAAEPTESLVSNKAR
jgi:transcriptional regulator with XRE-family HTH domain